MALAAGTRLGRYEIRSQIGKGGMGEVYLAHDTQLRRAVAIKVLPPQFTRDEERLHRFEQEARAASALNHPYIITIHEIGAEAGTHFIVTELISGKSLRGRMREGGMKIQEALDVSIQVASALSAAHEAGIVHRDIKPENLMIRPDGYVKVLDFGLAKLTEQSSTDQPVDPDAATLLETQPGLVLGTARYMSPEQARGLQVDRRTDIWSLGVVIYEMVAGHAPFEGATASHIIVSILENNPPRLERHAGGVPAELERIVAKALAKDREGRYQTIKDLMIDLRNLKQRSEFEAEKERSEHPVLARGAIAPSAEAAAPKYKRTLLSILAAFFAVSALAYLLYYLSHSKSAIDSLAVLPFVNTSADPDAEYLSDGITESLINSLSKLPAIRVIARSSVFRYKGHQMDPQAAGRELGVTAVLTGRVMQRGETLMISAELVNTRDNRHIWGEQYNRRLSDLLVVQQDIVNQMSDQLRPQLTGEQRRQALKNYTANIDAYQLYLKGRYYFNKTTDVAFQKSMTYFQQAVRIDPNYALAYAGIADSYYGLSWSTLSSKEAMPKARAAAEDALRIDDTLPEGHTSLAMVKWLYDWKWSEAEQEFRRALELNPSYAFAHQQYGIFLALMGRFDESQAELRNAKKLDPLSLWVNADLALSLYFARRYDQAIDQLQSTLDMDPNFENAHWMLWTIYEQKGMYAKAVDEYLKAASEIGTTADEIAALKKTYETAGWKGFLEQRLKQFQERSKRGYLSPRFIAEAYIDLGEKDQAFEWLDKALQSRDSISIWLKVHPEFDPLRSDPRFAELIRRVGLPP